MSELKSTFDEWLDIVKSKLNHLNETNTDETRVYKIELVPLEKSFGYEVRFVKVLKNVKTNE